VIIVDTSGLIAAYDRDDIHHQDVVRVLSAEGPGVLSPFVLAELDYLLATRAGRSVELRALRDVADGAYHLADLTQHDVARCILVIEQYASLDLGLADASIVVLALRLGCHDLLTLDQRHFRAVRPLDGGTFRLLPLDA